jgi:hypothetical protein
VALNQSLRLSSLTWLSWLRVGMFFSGCKFVPLERSGSTVSITVPGRPESASLSAYFAAAEESEPRVRARQEQREVCQTATLILSLSSSIIVGEMIWHGLV